MFTITGENSPTIHLTFISKLQGDIASNQQIGLVGAEKMFLTLGNTTGTLPLQPRGPVDHDGDRRRAFADGLLKDEPMVYTRKTRNPHMLDEHRLGNDGTEASWPC